LISIALALEQLEEALGHSVVVAVATPAHAAEQVVVAQEGLPLVASEVLQCTVPAGSEEMRHAFIDEPQGELLGQCTNGELLGSSKNGQRAWAQIRHT